MTALVHFWQGESPAESVEDFALQVARAEWVEKRTFKHLEITTNNAMAKLAKMLGAK
jgi:hypothetical protein